MAAQWFVYIIYSSETGKLYTGTSTDPRKRLDDHNGETNKGAKATRAGRPWLLVYVEPKPTQSDALKREAAIKKLSRNEKLVLCGLAS